jgi:hypothetical protein
VFGLVTVVTGYVVLDFLSAIIRGGFPLLQIWQTSDLTSNTIEIFSVSINMTVKKSASLKGPISLSYVMFERCVSTKQQAVAIKDWLVHSQRLTKLSLFEEPLFGSISLILLTFVTLRL